MMGEQRKIEDNAYKFPEKVNKTERIQKISNKVEKY